MNDLDLRLSARKPDRAASQQPLLGELLMERGRICADDLSHALSMQRHMDAPLGDILVAEGLVDKAAVLSALAVQASAAGADLALDPPAMQMSTRLSSALCLRHGVVPWREDELGLHVAASSPAGFRSLQAALGAAGRHMVPVIVDSAQIRAQQSRLYGRELAQKAETRVPARESCRSWSGQGNRRAAAAGA